MKPNLLNRFLSIVMTFIVTSILISSVMAQSSVKSPSKLERERLSRVMDAGTNIEEFRQEYLNYLTELQEDMRLINMVPVIQRKLNQGGLKPITMLTAAKASVSEMSQEDLTKVRAVYAKFPGWREMPEALIRPELRQELQAKLKAKIEGGVYANAATTDDCAAAITADFTNTDISINTALSIAAHAVSEALLPPFNSIAIAAWVATDETLLGIQTSKDIKDDCKNDTFQSAITTKVTAIPGLITASTSTTASNISTSTSTTATNITTAKTEIIANDDANRVIILAAVEAAKTYIVTDAHANKDEVKNLLLRTQIEADLASTDGSTFVALYETPTNVCLTSLNEKGLPQSVSLPGFPTITIPQCGLLDLVRSIVRDTIANVGAGTNAQSFFNTGDAQKAAFKYKAAYASYRQAYKAASK